MIDLPRRSYGTGTNDRDSSRDWNSIRTEISSLAENYTEIADTNWSLRDSRGGDIAFVSFQMQGKFRHEGNDIAFVSFQMQAKFRHARKISS